GQSLDLRRRARKLRARRNPVNRGPAIGVPGTEAVECGNSGAAPGAGPQQEIRETMLDKAKRLITPSRRSDVPSFMAMDVMAAAARIEAAGGRVIHMEVGQPAAPAPSTAIAAARAALTDGRLGYTEALGIASLRRRIARHYNEK